MEVKLAYNKLHIFKMYSLMSYDGFKSIHLWNHHHNQSSKHIYHPKTPPCSSVSPSFPPPSPVNRWSAVTTHSPAFSRILIIYSLDSFTQHNYFEHFLFYWFLERKRKGETDRQTDINLLFNSFMHSLVASCMCPDWRSTLQPWRIGMTLWPTELPVQDNMIILRVTRIQF